MGRRRPRGLRRVSPGPCGLRAKGLGDGGDARPPLPRQGEARFRDGRARVRRARALPQGLSLDRGAQVYVRRRLQRRLRAADDGARTQRAGALLSRSPAHRGHHRSTGSGAIRNAGRRPRFQRGDPLFRAGAERGAPRGTVHRVGQALFRTPDRRAAGAGAFPRRSRHHRRAPAAACASLGQTPFMQTARQKYLERYAEPEAALAANLVGPYGHAVVLPAYGEGDELVAALASISKGPGGRVLVVLVLNAKATATPWMHDRNRAVVTRLREIFGRTEEWQLAPSPPARLFTFAAGHVLLIDRSEKAHWFPDDQGVGLARKIGVDLCLALHETGRLGTRFVHTTDADVELPDDYFERPELTRGEAGAALVYSFSHRPERDRKWALAIALYEISLRYYVLGLRFAGSPSAYHTIGSTLAVDVDAYAAVRGFPKRDAAEGAERFTLYHPCVFRYLAAWDRAMVIFARQDSDLELAELVRAACAEDQLEPGCLVEAGQDLGAFDALTLARGQAKDGLRLERRLHTWF